MAKDKRSSKGRSDARILITGGTGFLGTHVVRQLIDAGETNLKVLASRVPEWMKDAGVKAVEGSVTDTETCIKACKNVSAILHLAGKVSRDNADAVAMNKVHLTGTRLLSQAAVGSGVSTMIVASSSGTIAVSETASLANESTPQPVGVFSRWAYYASKYYQERAAIEEFTGEGRRLIFMHPSLLLGPDDERLSSTKVVLDLIGKKVPYCPSGGLNFVDARDAATAFIAALERGKDGDRFLLGAENLTFASFFERLGRLAGVSAPRLKVPKQLAVMGSGMIESFFNNWGRTSPVATDEVDQAEHFWYFSSEKAREELGFDPRDPQETLNDTVAYIKQNFLGGDIF